MQRHYLYAHAVQQSVGDSNFQSYFTTSGRYYFDQPHHHLAARKPLDGSLFWASSRLLEGAWLPVYVHPDASGCATPSCLYGESYLNQFTYGKYVLDNMPNQFAPTTQLMTDFQSGTLPQVSFIEPAGYVGLDEHPTDTDVTNAPNVQAGAAYVESIVDGLMGSPSWKDS